MSEDMRVEHVRALIAAVGEWRWNYKCGTEDQARKILEAHASAVAWLPEPPIRTRHVFAAVESLDKAIHLFTRGSATRIELERAQREMTIEAATLLVDWFAPPRKEASDADVTGLIADHGRAAE